MTHYSVREAEAELARLIAAALAGENVVIPLANGAAVKLVPVSRSGQRRFGTMAGKLKLHAPFHEPLPDNELDGWYPG